ncbi:hypothetical protein L9F63_019975 [Diploptera punctata]|uniref:Uncharacterized protein n=1 Tax=Diploptera punctata TaxID=6984 RepID=A0AAD8EE02_DIPPU|nr:hypothetical protein L9F63_019975 [Diploptera punctata]
MVSTIMQAAVTSNVPQLMILQMLQLISDWQNPSDLTWYRSLEEITTQCPIQKIEFLKLAKECDKIPTDKSISEEISKTLEKIHVKFGTSSAINQVRDVSSNQYINVNLGEALEEKTYMIQELRMKIKDIEMKQLTEIESRLEYETQFIQQIQEQQNQLENLRSLVKVLQKLKLINQVFYLILTNNRIV